MPTIRAATRGKLLHGAMPMAPSAKGPWQGLEDTFGPGKHHVSRSANPWGKRNTNLAPSASFSYPEPRARLRSCPPTPLYPLHILVKCYPTCSPTCLTTFYDVLIVGHAGEH